MAEMTQQEIADFLAESHVAHIATVRPDGRPHLTPISYIADLENGGKVYVMAPENTVKFQNIRRNPRVSLSVANDQRPFDYVLLEGEAGLPRTTWRTCWSGCAFDTTRSGARPGPKSCWPPGA